MSLPEPARHLVCDQCLTHHAPYIDAEAKTWCQRCCETAAATAAAQHTLAPVVFDISFVYVVVTEPENLLWTLANPALRERWARRLGL